MVEVVLEKGLVKPRNMAWDVCRGGENTQIGYGVKSISGKNGLNFNRGDRKDAGGSGKTGDDLSTWGGIKLDDVEGVAF